MPFPFRQFLGLPASLGVRAYEPEGAGLETAAGEVTVLEVAAAICGVRFRACILRPVGCRLVRTRSLLPAGTSDAGTCAASSRSTT